MKRVGKLLLSGLLIYSLICLVVFLIQHKLVYFPGLPPTLLPSEYGLDFEDVTLVTSDGERLHAWYMPRDGARGTVVFCHGNAGNIEIRLPKARAFHRMGYAVLLFDYRGYGNSTGSPNEEGTYLDAEAAYDWLVREKKTPADEIIAYGQSLGGAVAVELARRRQIGLLIAEASFTSLPDIGKTVYPWLPVSLLSRIRYDSLGKIQEVSAPLIALHASDDDLVPMKFGRQLFDAAHEPKRWIETEGGHNGGGFLAHAGFGEELRLAMEELLVKGK